MDFLKPPLSRSDLIYVALKLKFDLEKVFAAIFDHLYTVCWGDDNPPDIVIYDMNYHLRPERALEYFTKEARKDIDMDHFVTQYSGLLFTIEEFEKDIGERFDAVIFVAVEESPIISERYYAQIREFVFAKFLEKPFKEAKDKLNDALNKTCNFNVDDVLENMANNL